MASGREIIPIGEAAAVLYDDTNMNGSNGQASPVIFKPGDREGLAIEDDAGACILYVQLLSSIGLVAMGVAED